MFHPLTIKRIAAVSVSLLALAGCAQPTAPVPATVAAVAPTEPAAQAVPTDAAAAPQLAEAAPAAVAPTVIEGAATYRGEALAGYDLEVFDALTNAPVPVRSDLAGASGLAVKASSLKTDAQGRFRLEVVGLAPGRALRVAVTQGIGRLEAVVMGDGAALGAQRSAYTTLDAGSTLSVNERSTALNKLARGVLRATRVLTPGAASPVLQNLAREMMAIAPLLDAQLAQGGFGAAMVQQDGEGLSSMLANAGSSRAVALTLVKLVTEVAEAAKDTQNRQGGEEAANHRIDLSGTPLQLTVDLKTGAVTLANRYTGQSFSAGDAGVSTLVTTPSGSSSHSNTPDLPPDPEPEPGVKPAFESAKLFTLDKRMTMAVVHLAEGRLPADFTEMKAELYDRDGNKLADAANTQDVTYQVQKAGGDGLARLVLTFRRLSTGSEFLGLFETIYQRLFHESSRWTYTGMPGLPVRMTINTASGTGSKLKWGKEREADALTEAQLLSFDTDRGETLTVSPGLFKTLNSVTGLEVKLYDRFGTCVGSTKADKDANPDLWKSQGKNLLVKVPFKPDGERSLSDNSQWTFGTFYTQAATLRLIFKDAEGNEFIRTVCDSEVEKSLPDGFLDDAK